MGVLHRFYREPCEVCGDDMRLVSMWDYNVKTGKEELIASHLLCDNCGAKRCVSQDVLDTRIRRV